jgi:hypothetical protein
MESGLSFYLLGLVGGGDASFGDFFVEFCDSRNALVDNSFVDKRPEGFGRLQLWGIGRQINEANALKFVMVKFATNLPVRMVAAAAAFGLALSASTWRNVPFELRNPKPPFVFDSGRASHICVCVPNRAAAVANTLIIIQEPFQATG